MASSIDDNVADGNSGKSLCEMWMIQYTIVLTAASAASLLILWRSLHKKNRVKTHASMVLYTVLFMPELLLYIPLLILGYS